MTMKTKSNPNLSAAEIAFVRSLVIHEDEHVLAFNKPAGLSSQGGRGQAHTLDELLARSPSRAATGRGSSTASTATPPASSWRAKTKPAAAFLGRR